MNVDWQTIAANGIFAVAFFALLKYTLAQNDRREARLISFIEHIVPVLEKLCREVEEIRRKLSSENRKQGDKND